MEKIFLSILNMSLTASFVLAVIMLARLALKKAPKIISYALWAVAWFRLAFPIRLEGVFSLIPFKAAPIPQDIAVQAIPRFDSGIAALDNAVSASLPAAVPYASINPLQIWLALGSYVWLLGVAVMLCYSIASIVLLKRSLRGAAHIEDNLYEAENLRTPFVIGILRPRIYIPAGLSGEEREYIILHEQTHIRRGDHAVKMFAYLVLCLHWFNPLAWAAFVLMGADMEMSCDERVMHELGDGIKRAYSLSLVRMATRRRILNGSPLAFGEGGMKERVKNVLNFKKPLRIVIVAAMTLVAVLSVGLAFNEKQPPEPPDMTELSGAPSAMWRDASKIVVFSYNINKGINTSQLSDILSRLQLSEETITPDFSETENSYIVYDSIPGWSLRMYVSEEGENYIECNRSYPDGASCGVIEYIILYNSFDFMRSVYFGILNPEELLAYLDEAARATLLSYQPLSSGTGEEAREAETTLNEAFYAAILSQYELCRGIMNVNGREYDEIKYIAVDMAGVFESEHPRLEADLRAWTDSLGYELLLDTYEGLVDLGYIEGMGFHEGIFIQIEESYFGGFLTLSPGDKSALTIQINGCISLHGVGFPISAAYTALFKDGIWRASMNGMWKTQIG